MHRIKAVGAPGTRFEWIPTCDALVIVVKLPGEGVAPVWMSIPVESLNAALALCRACEVRDREVTPITTGDAPGRGFFGRLWKGDG